jgi:thermitase
MGSASEYYSSGALPVDADVIWANTAASPLVAVIDTGVDYTHPDLVGKVVKGYNFVEGTADPMDDHGHGTHVSGVIAARLNNKVGIPGISNGSVLAIKALDFSGSGTYYEIAQASYAANNAAVKSST